MTPLLYVEMILILLIGFGTGYYCKSTLAKSQIVDTKRHVDALGQLIGALQSEIGLMRAAAERLNDARCPKRFLRKKFTYASQIRFISQSELRAVRPVNKEAARILYALDEWMVSQRPDWRMAFEVSMGAFIKTASDSNDWVQNAAFRSYNSKRVDFLLIDRFGHPVLVVEYHGTGHDLSSDAPDRMAVKRLALERAGIPLVEIPAKASKSDIARIVNEKLSPDTPPTN